MTGLLDVIIYLDSHIEMLAQLCCGIFGCYFVVSFMLEVRSVIRCIAYGLGYALVFVDQIALSIKNHKGISDEFWFMLIYLTTLAAILLVVMYVVALRSGQYELTAQWVIGLSYLFMSASTLAVDCHLWSRLSPRFPHSTWINEAAIFVTGIAVVQGLALTVMIVVMVVQIIKSQDIQNVAASKS